MFLKVRINRCYFPKIWLVYDLRQWQAVLSRVLGRGVGQTCWEGVEQRCPLQRAVIDDSGHHHTGLPFLNVSLAFSLVCSCI